MARTSLAFLVALAVNAAVLAATFVLVPFAPSREPVPVTVLVPEQDFVDSLEEEVAPECEEQMVVDRSEDVLGHPVIKDAKVSDHNETDNDLPFEDALGKKDFLSDAPFGGPSSNAVVGIGGGAGGFFGARGGRRNLRAQGGAPTEGFDAPPIGRESYDPIDENVFQDPEKHPLSTFSIDVDTASMSNVRRLLTQGTKPPQGAVRIEEMLNYYDYDYAQPTGPHPFAIVTEVAQCPWNPRHRLVHVGIQGKVIEAEEVPARNLVFLLDVSGSMSGAAKLPLVKRAMALLVKELREIDRVGIVVYAGASGVVLEPTAGSEKQEILAAIGRLSSGGSTNAGAGIQLAYDLARKHFDRSGINRVILATDGDFNVGITSRSDLLTLIETERRSGVFLTVLGVGSGNLQDSQMEMLADKGNGNYAYLDSIAEAEKVLVREASSTLVTIAKDVKIQVEFNPNRVGSYRLIGYENRKLAARDFNDDKKDAGEIGAGASVTALYEVTMPGDNGGSGTDPLRYQTPRSPDGAAFGDEILCVKVRYKAPDGDVSRLVKRPVLDPGSVSYGSTSRDYRFAAAVATFGMALRETPERGNASYALAKELLAGTAGDDPHGERRALAGLIDRAAALTR